MQAITTKYIGATNTKGSRIKAECERGSITIGYPSELSGDAVHVAAAQALVDKFIKEDAASYGTHKNPWSLPRVMGTTKGGIGVHVFLEQSKLVDALTMVERIWSEAGGHQVSPESPLAIVREALKF